MPEAPLRATATVFESRRDADRWLRSVGERARDDAEYLRLLRAPVYCAGARVGVVSRVALTASKGVALTIDIDRRAFARARASRRYVIVQWRSRDATRVTLELDSLMPGATPLVERPTDPAS